MKLCYQWNKKNTYKVGIISFGKTLLFSIIFGHNLPVSLRNISQHDDGSVFFRFDVRHDGDDQYEYGEVRMFVGAESM